MPTYTFKPLLKVLFLIVLLYPNHHLYSQDVEGSSKEDFLKMARYLSEGSGKWMTDNPNYDSSDPTSYRALGLWFDLKLNENHLNLRIVTYTGKIAEVITTSMWIWHPGEQKIKYYDIKGSGTFMDGETYFVSDSVFVTRSFTYRPSGKVHFALGENIMISNEKHRTISRIFENGGWRVQADFVWRKTEENEGYDKVVHK